MIKPNLEISNIVEDNIDLQNITNNISNFRVENLINDINSPPTSKNLNI